MRKIVSAVVLTVFCAQISGCNGFGEQDVLNSGFQDLKTYFERAQDTQRVAEADRIESTSAAITGVVLSTPSLEGRLTQNPDEAKVFIQVNQDKIWKWLDDVDAAAAASRKQTYDISKEAFLSKDDRVVVRDYSLLYYSLEFQRDVYKQVVRTVTPFVMAVGSPAIKDFPEVASFRETLLKRFFAYVGSQMVARNDLVKVGSTLSFYKKRGALEPAIEQIVKGTRDQISSDEQKESQGVQQALSRLSEADRASLKQQVKTFTAGYEKVTFLYNPDQDFGPVVNALIVLGNLTWGLCNTLIGAGIVLATMAASAFDPYVDFPTFRVAENGHMIYVDVNNMGTGGKLSMGLFELDSHAGWSYASGHEGVHALQSALLGPLYLPAVIASYMVSGFDQGFFEDWADAWADL